MAEMRSRRRPLHYALALLAVAMFAACGSEQRDFAASAGSAGVAHGGSGAAGRSSGGANPASGGDTESPEAGTGGDAVAGDNGGEPGGTNGIAGSDTAGGVGGNTGGAGASSGMGGAAPGCGGTGGSCTVCEPKAYRCNGAVSEQCATDGLHYIVDRACGAVGCDAITGRCNQCNPTQSQCGANEYCDSTNCATSGFCATRPAATATTFGPVCGCDGEAYWNATHAHWLGKSAFTGGGSAGTCLQPKQCTANAQCGTNETCIVTVQDYQCTSTPNYGFCMAKPATLTSAACTGLPASGDGEQQCGGTCISFCTAFRLGKYTRAEGCGA